MRLQARFPLHSSRFTLEHDTGGASEGSGVTVAEKKVSCTEVSNGGNTTPAYMCRTDGVFTSSYVGSLARFIDRCI